MHKKLLILTFFINISALWAQIGIGTTDPKTTLDVQGNAADINSLDGMTAPRVTGDQLAAKTYTTDQNGTLVYVTAATTSPSGQTAEVSAEGLYVFNASQNKWISLISSGSGAGWALNGNTISSGEFLGTLNNLPLEFKTNNVLHTRITQRGQIETLNTSNSVYLGELAGANSYATTANNTFVGYGADYDAGGASNSLIIGYNSRVSSNNSIVIGTEADADSDNSIAIGRSTQSQGTYGVVIGDAAYTTRTGAIAIGQSSQSQGDRAIAIGKSSYSSGSDAIAIGNQAQSQAVNTVAIGNGVYAPNPNTMILGTNLNVGIGTNNPTAKLQVNGTFRYVDASPGDDNGKVLTSDANGNASWQVPASQQRMLRKGNVSAKSGSTRYFNFDTSLYNTISGASYSGTSLILPEGVYEIESSLSVGATHFVNYNVRINGVVSTQSVQGTAVAVKYNSDISPNNQIGIVTIPAGGATIDFVFVAFSWIDVPLNGDNSWLKISRIQ